MQFQTTDLQKPPAMTAKGSRAARTRQPEQNNPGINTRADESFRAKKLAGYLRSLERKKISARELLAGTGIDWRLDFNDDRCVLSAEHYHAVVANMMRLTGDPGIALSMGETLNLTEFGIVGYAMIAAKSLRESVDVWITYSNFLLGAPIRADEFHETLPGFEVVLSSPPVVGRLQVFETEELLVQGIRVLRYLTGIEPVLEEIEFSYAEPPWRQSYDERFKCRLKFGAPRTVIRFLAPRLTAPIVTMNEEVFRLCIRQCAEISSELDDITVLRGKLRCLFMASPARVPDMKAIGNQLGISERSLARRLRASGDSFQAIKDEFRFELAREYLLSGFMSQKQVAYLLGFSSPSTFSRAFKRWSGQTVERFINDNKSPARQAP